MKAVGGQIECGFIDDDGDEEGAPALTRAEALAHPARDDVFAMLDLVADTDPRVREHFERTDWVSH